MSYRTIPAAEALLASTTRDTWALADAVMADTPDGGDIRQGLADLVDALAEQQITNVNGDPYTVSMLADMRNTARWAPGERHPEAAYRTHQEAGPPGSKGRDALAALAAVARDEPVECPPTIDPSSFQVAKAKVQHRKAGPRKPRFPVTANDVRVAMSRQTNTPPNKRDSNVVYLLGHLAGAADALQSFAGSYVSAEPEVEDRSAIAGALRRLITTAETALEVVTTSEVSDADLEDLLERK